MQVEVERDHDALGTGALYRLDDKRLGNEAFVGMTSRIFTVLSSLLFCLLSWSPSAFSAPQLQITPPQREFGRQAKNLGAYPFAFKLRNVGDQPVKIDSVRGGCACLAVTLPKREIPPGEEVELSAVFHSAGYEGHIEKAIFLASNDESSRMRVLSFHVFLPYSSAGLRFNPHCYRIPVQTAGKALKAAPVVENCNPSGVINLTAVKLPEGWRCTTPFPVAVKAESCSAPFEFIRDDGMPLPPNAELLFVFKTDSPKQPELKAVLVPAKPPALPPVAQLGHQVTAAAPVSGASPAPVTPPPATTKRAVQTVHLLVAGAERQGPRSD